MVLKVEEYVLSGFRVKEEKRTFVKVEGPTDFFHLRVRASALALAPFVHFV
jgi:hypothetical protein